MLPRMLWSVLGFFLCVLVAEAHELVDISTVDSGICVQIRNPDFNYTRAFLVRQVAKQLSRVQKDLEKDCIRLVVFDAYRPFRMANFFEKPYAFQPFDECNPISNGHYRGTAVDVTIAYQDGQVLEMPPYLDIYELAECQTDYFSFSCQAYHNLQKLQKAMIKHRFVPSPTEWWHFDYREWSQYPVLDVPFEELTSIN